mgnify:CR=1 FL=1
MSNAPEIHNPLWLTTPTEKLRVWNEACEIAWQTPDVYSIPTAAQRDIEVLPPTLHPPKLGFSHAAGRARVIHDLASIELQAMELALRTLVEFPEAPPEFRRSLRDLAINEGEHFALCLNTLADMDFQWGHWPIHNGLWDCVRSDDSLLDRVLLVHRFLEGSGLDAGFTLHQRLSGVKDAAMKNCIARIHREELGHVQFGSRWFHHLSESSGKDPAAEFLAGVLRLLPRLPKRVEPLNVVLRSEAEFTPREIEICQKLRSYFLAPKIERDQFSESWWTG